jgi:sugar/nucleoside kinase (ribokinase family)
MGPAHIDEHTISSSRWLLLEGYFLTASSHNTDALYHSIALAKKHGTKVAFSASAEFVISSRRDEIMQKVLPLSDLIFANQGEALLLTQTSDPLAALHHLAQRTPSVVITRGNQGAHGIFQGASWEVQASKPAGPVVDTTGAGDAFAGVYLAGLTLGHSPQTAAQGAAQIASLVVTQRGAQLPLETYTVFT